ncbi:MAG TPA: YlbF family regulator [Firmicutes bacterium]|nr:YlbF family regulator [Bacillota bacterium]
MDLIQLARDLGTAIQEDEAYITLQMAKTANDNDKDLQDAIGEFNLKRIAISEEMNKKEEEKNNERLAHLDKELRDAYGKIMSNENMMRYNEAKTKVDTMMNQISAILMMAVNGEDPQTVDPAACTGSCSSCAGCH